LKKNKNDLSAGAAAWPFMAIFAEPNVNAGSSLPSPHAGRFVWRRSCASNLDLKAPPDAVS